MPDAILIPAGGGEVIGDAADRRVEILSDHPALHATWSRFGPRREGADLHLHRRHTDCFYVLQGELGLRLGVEDRLVRVGAGTLARMPAGVVHGFRNAGDAELRYLNLHAPGRGFADYLRAIRDGRTLVYDQEPPPDDGSIRSPGDAVIARPEPGPDGMVVLADEPDVAVAEAPGVPDAWAGPHAHADHVESLYVLDGELGVTAGEQELLAGAGDWVQIPAGVPHALLAEDGALRLLHVHTPLP